MKKFFSDFFAVAAFLLLSGCAQQASNANSNKGNSGNVLSGTINVDIRNFAFSPASITIKQGSTVVWTNFDDAPHTATSSQNFDSGTITKGSSWSHTFSGTGTVDYICTIHPFMKGTVVVVS